MIFRTLVLLLLLLGAESGMAQQRRRSQKAVKTENMPKYDRRKFHFGINLGISHAGLAVRPRGDLRDLLPDTVYGVRSIWQPGFSMGIESNMRLTELLDLRFTPTLTLASRYLEFDRPKGIDVFQFESTLAEFPVYIKFKSVRLTNFRMYLIGGFKYTFDMASKVGAEDGASYPIKLRPHDLITEAGIGMDFYTPFFKFSPQLKVSWGLLDLNYPESNFYNQSIDALRTRAVYISFLFE
ncbi:MAG: outer membrane beta-barrel protein [Bacteroidetes bacterium]|nr:outer membrane beta-barrel protein [Bacteroidota bacterium]